MADLDDDELLDALGVDATPIKISSRTPREERIIAGFEDILRFHQTHGRAPQHGEGGDIFERLYAVRLDQLRKLPEAHALLAGLDAPGLLAGASVASSNVDALDEDALLAELGVDVPSVDGQDIRVLKHVRSIAEKRLAEEIANREKCVDFAQFEPLFDAVRSDLKSGIRQGRSFQSKEKALDDIVLGAYFIIGGQIAYIAEVGEEFTTEYGRRDSRLRVVFDNGTEASVLMRSLQRSLHRDESARLVSDPEAGPLFGGTPEEGDIESGTIYVLRSLSNLPFVVEHRQLIHKIGVTGGKVESRIATAKNDATYLLADVEVVATYKLHNMNRVKLENIFHRLFGAARLDLTIEDRFGQPVKPQEWFLVRLDVIDEAVQRIQDGSITRVHYDVASGQLVE
ncbi:MULTISPECIES: GIY-YIG nuclease family protein [unclassified Polaromonas]|uniref:GIY-YIG nuclease family protein n=1 Tax=unclassified Polaromonas TaxID=2638319 RepID=UPI000F079259|nr:MULTISPECIES: GIY-YIG nuclease family protein [unclassified Polaromonas]AYQ26718.1 GIY-YIG nuclease family protein [Polaromonas sp. SP1]QGJ18436.1 GIY-YIG nuclease family protein [Polaromonas sp. Pch-P]